MLRVESLQREFLTTSEYEKIIENRQKERMESRIRLEQVKKQPPSFSQTEGKEVKLAVGVSL